MLAPLDPLRSGVIAAEEETPRNDSASHSLRQQMQFQRFATQRFQDQVERLAQSDDAVDADAELAQMQVELERQLASLSTARQFAQRRKLEEADAEAQWDQLQERLDRLSPRRCVEPPGDDLHEAFNQHVALGLESEMQHEDRTEDSPPTPPLVSRLLSRLMGDDGPPVVPHGGLPAGQHGGEASQPRPGLPALLARLDAKKTKLAPPRLESTPPPQPPELMASPGPAIPRHQRSAVAKRERNRKKREKRALARHKVAHPEAAARDLPPGAVAPVHTLHFEGSWKVRQRMAATAFNRGVMAERAAAKERRGAKRLEKAAGRRAKAAAMRCGRRRRAARI